MTITPQDLVRREVHYCVSSLIYTLAEGYGCADFQDDIRPGGPVHDMMLLAEQAFELSRPVPDYEEAAREAGWTGPHVDEWGVTYFSADDDATWACRDWEALCLAHDIEPYDREVFEHWIVSDWLADKLAAKGEKVDKDFAGMTVWARTTTGQAIYMDAVIGEIVEDLNRD